MDDEVPRGRPHLGSFGWMRLLRRSTGLWRAPLPDGRFHTGALTPLASSSRSLSLTLSAQTTLAATFEARKDHHAEQRKPRFTLESLEKIWPKVETCLTIYDLGLHSHPLPPASTSQTPSHSEPLERVNLLAQSDTLRTASLFVSGPNVESLSRPTP